jgi:hypothetical protein
MEPAGSAPVSAKRLFADKIFNVQFVIEIEQAMNLKLAAAEVVQRGRYDCINLASIDRGPEP